MAELLFVDIDAPIQQAGSSSSSEPSVEQVSMLADMGFSTAQAKKALRETVSVDPLEQVSHDLIYDIGRRRGTGS